MKRRVVVTGMGMITPVGNDVATTWRSLIEGKSGTAPITKFDASNFPVRFAAEVKGFNPLDYMDRKEARRADPYTHYAVAAARQAMTDAGLAGGHNGMDPDRIGVIIGSGASGRSLPSSFQCSSPTSPPALSRCSSTPRVQTTPPYQLAPRVLTQ